MGRDKLALGLSILLGLLLITTVVLIAVRWNTSLGPRLPYGFQTENAASADHNGDPRSYEKDSTQSAGEKPTRTPPPTATEYSYVYLVQLTESPTPTLDPTCGGPPVMTVLAIGADNRPNNYLYGLGDVIRLIRLDFENRRVSSLSLPRDLWVEIPKLKPYGISHGKLNQAYVYGTKGMGYFENEAHGAGLLALTLDHNFDVRLDHYITVNMKTFRKMVNHIGGVFIHVPETLDGRTDKSFPKKTQYGYFSAGSHYLDGVSALWYARIRKMDNDFRRQERQSQLLKAIWQRVLSPDILEAIPDLIDFFRKGVLTDLSPEQMAQIACLVTSLEEDDLNFYHLDRDLFRDVTTNTNEYGLLIEKEKLSGILSKFLAGKTPNGLKPLP